MKRSKLKLYAGRVLEFPGASIAFIIYAAFALFGQTNGVFGGKLRNALLNAIPTIASTFWPIAIVISFMFWLRLI
jgi:hypothetical protein